jgi:transcriptional regulator with XRE-family HTH domain
LPQFSAVSALVGRHVREVRRWRGMSQQELGVRMSDRGFRWTQTTVSRLERGGYVCSVDELAALAYVLEMPITRLLPDLSEAS